MTENQQTAGTTLEQRRALIAAYQRTRNMSAAMRETGIRSPRTGYLWLKRFEECGDAGLEPRSRARKTQRTIPNEIAARAVQIRQEHPQWGRRRIAREIQSRHGGNAISPAGVEAILRRNSLWLPASKPETAPARTTAATPLRSEYVALDKLLPTIVDGIEASLSSRAALGVALLGTTVWRQLGVDREMWSRFLADQAVGPLLLRSRTELGRSLMNTGEWRESARVFEETLGWLKRAAPETREPAGVVPISGMGLRRADAWLETYQHLGIVLTHRSPAAAQSYLRIALDSLRSPSRRLVPLQPALVEGNIERDLARHLLRHAESKDEDIEQHLARSGELLVAAGDRAMLAATDIGWADLQSRRAIRLHSGDRQARMSVFETMEAALERSLAVFETLDSPILHTNLLIDAARLAVLHGLGLDHRQVQQAAMHCLVFGYGGQAQQLLRLPGVDRALPPDVVEQLSRLVPRADGGDTPRARQESR